MVPLPSGGLSARLVPSGSALHASSVPVDRIRRSSSGGGLVAEASRMEAGLERSEGGGTGTRRASDGIGTLRGGLDATAAQGLEGRGAKVAAMLAFSSGEPILVRRGVCSWLRVMCVCVCDCVQSPMAACGCEWSPLLPCPQAHGTARLAKDCTPQAHRTAQLLHSCTPLPGRMLSSIYSLQTCKPVSVLYLDAALACASRMLLLRISQPCKGQAA